MGLQKNNTEYKLRRTGWWLMTIMAVLLCLYSSAYFLPGMPFSFRPDVYPVSSLTLFLLAHIGGGMLAVIAGPLQFWSHFRAKYKKWHRLLGLIYLTGVVIGAPAALIISPISQGGLTTHIGFAILAILWGATTLIAYLKIISKDYEAHQQWMIRSYALTLAFVSLRIWLGGLTVTGAPFEEVYQSVAWLCWVPNLIVAELYLGWQGKRLYMQDLPREITTA